MNDENSAVRQSELSLIARGGVLVLNGMIIGNLLRYVFQILVARELGAEIFGLFVVGLTIFTVAEIFVELGLPTGVVRFVALYGGMNDRPRTKGIIIMAVRTVLTTGAVVGFLLFVSAGPVSTGIFSDARLSLVLKIFALILPFAAASTVLLFVFQGLKVIRPKVIIGEFIEPGLRVALALALFIWGWTLSRVLYAYLGVTLLTLAIIILELKKLQPGLFDRAVPRLYEKRRWLSFSWPLLLIQFIGFLIMAMDTLMLGLWRPFLDVGIYGAAQKTAYFGSLIQTSFGSIFAPVIADLFNRRESAAVEHIYKTVSKWTRMFSLPVCFLMILGARELLSLFGPAYSPAAVPLTILSLGWLVNASMGLAGLILVMSGRTKLHLLNYALLLGLNLLLNAFLIPPLGLIGASLATAVSLSLIGIVTVIEVAWIQRIHPFSRQDFKEVAASLVALAAALALRPYLGGSPLLRLGVIVLVYGLIYLIILLKLKLGPEDKKIWKELLTIRGKRG